VSLIVVRRRRWHAATISITRPDAHRFRFRHCGAFVTVARPVSIIAGAFTGTAVDGLDAFVFGDRLPRLIHIDGSISTYIYDGVRVTVTVRVRVTSIHDRAGDPEALVRFNVLTDPRLTPVDCTPMHHTESVHLVKYGEGQGQGIDDQRLIKGLRLL